MVILLQSFFKLKSDDKESEPSTSTSTSTLQWSQPCRHFQFSEIQLATNNFDESLVIGRGGFGKVYKGNIINGGTSLFGVAIKRLDSMSDQGAAEFWAEVEILSKLRHCHLVSLIGYCNYKKEMLLVYEYMPHGTLEEHLHKFSTPLHWLQRLKICLGAARGLDYLHTGTGVESAVIHRDVKSSNILLHETWAAKISDFGLSRIGPTNQPLTYVNASVKGTFGYFDPDYFRTGRLTRKSDVYAFGVVLFEVLCRKRAVDKSLGEDQWSLITWAQDSIKEGNLKNVIDYDIRDEISSKCLKEFVRIAEKCLLNNPKQRPTMAEVVVCLESVLALQEKIDRSSEGADRTIFGRMLDMFPFPSNTAHGDPKLSSNINDNNTRQVPADYRIPSPNLKLKIFKFNDLKRATRNFNKVLGVGSFGTVSLGWVDHKTLTPSRQGVGMAVAVKRLRQDSLQGVAEWLTEVNSLQWLAHPNIISLLGYCCDDNEYLLVYEYMQNRSFDRFLFSNAPHIVNPLSWGTRLKIMIGVARGLDYLHSLKDQLICRSLKSADILLDKDFNSKLGDFGLVRSGPETGKTHVTTRVVGTTSYIDPEYLRTGHLSAKTDIYGFGMVLLEALTGQKEINFIRYEDDQYLVDLESSFLTRERNLEKIMDPRLENNYPREGAFECCALALRCVANKPKDRPSSEEVLQSLEQIYATK